MTLNLIQESNRIIDAANSCSVSSYLKAFLTENHLDAISNAVTKIGLLQWQEASLPITINEGEQNDTEKNNSYVCFPYSAYFPYAVQESLQLSSINTKFLAKYLLPLVGNYYYQKEFDKNIHINNWLLSTNLYPDKLDLSLLPKLKEMFVDTFPMHGIILRSLNRFHHPKLLSKLEQLGGL